MVVIQIKAGDVDTFLYETTSDTSNDIVVREIVDIWNMRIRLRQLCGGIRELARYGPMKHPSKAGLDKIDEEYKGERVEKGEFYEADPTGMRTGNGVGPGLTDTFERVARDAEAVIDKVCARGHHFLAQLRSSSYSYNCSRWQPERWPQDWICFRKNWTIFVGP
jgi:hypothetical protein